MGPAYRTLLDIALAAALLAGGADGNNGGANPTNKEMLSAPAPAPTARPGQGALVQTTCAECAGGCSMQGSAECLWRGDPEVTKMMLNEGKTFDMVCEQFSGVVCGSGATAPSGCGSCQGCFANGQCTALNDPDFQKYMEGTGNSASEVCAGESGVWCSSDDPVIMPPSPGPEPAIKQVRPDGCGECRGCYFGPSNYCQQPIDHAENEDPEDACDDEGGTFCADPRGFEKEQDKAPRQSCIDGICGTGASSVDDDEDDSKPEGGCAGCKDGCFFERTDHCITDLDMDSGFQPWEECKMMNGHFCGEIIEDVDLYATSDCRHCQGGCVLPEKNYCVLPGDPDVEVLFGGEESEDDATVDLTPANCKKVGGTFCSTAAAAFH